MYVKLFCIIDTVYEKFKELLRSLDLVWFDVDTFSCAVHAKKVLFKIVVGL